MKLRTIAVLLTFSAAASAQVGVRPALPPPIRGYSPPPPIISAPAARQSALPLAAPSVSPLMRRPGGVIGFGGFYSPWIAPAYGAPAITINYNVYLPPPVAVPRFIGGDLPPLISYPDRARLTLAVPNAAEVFINGKKVDMVGQRTFESPTLEPGEIFSFDIRVIWVENGKVVEESRKLDLRAGDSPSLQYVASPGR